MSVKKININQQESSYYIASDIYDVTANNNGATFESLSALLSDENLSTLIPTAVRCGGMTIRFVQSADNKYVQYRLMSTSFSTTESDWQGVDDEPTSKSANLVKSDGVALISMKAIIYGKGAIFSASNFVLTKGNSYRVYIDNPNWLRDDLEGADERTALFQVASFTRDVETIILRIEIRENAPIRKFYTFDVPMDSDYIRIGLRANVGEKIVLEVCSLEECKNVTNDLYGLFKSSELQIYRGWMKSSNKCDFITTNNYLIIPIKPSDELALIGSKNNSYYAFLKSDTLPSANGESFDLCEGESRRMVGYNSSTSIAIPSDAKFLYVGLGVQNLIGINDYIPMSIYINGIDYIDRRYNTKRECVMMKGVALPNATHIPTENPSFNTLYAQVKKGDRIYFHGDIAKVAKAFTMQFAFYDSVTEIGMSSEHLISYGGFRSDTHGKIIISNVDGYFAVHFRFISDDGTKIIQNVFNVTTDKNLEPVNPQTNINSVINRIENLEKKPSTSPKIYQLRNSYNYPMYDCHRGVQAYGPENSLPAFLAGGFNNVWSIETDFRMTSDGVVVCMHDSTINRTMRNMDGTTIAETIEVLSKTLSELRNNYKIGEVNSTTIPNKQYVYDDFDISELVIPTMDDYFDICQQYGITPFIELKTDNGIIDQMIDGIKRHDLIGRCVVSSSDISLLASYRNKGGMEFIHKINGVISDIDTLLQLGNAGIAFNITNYNADITGQYIYKDYNPQTPKQLVEMCHKLRLLVCFRAADTKADARNAISIGLNYIPTNNLWLKSQID